MEESYHALRFDTAWVKSRPTSKVKTHLSFIEVRETQHQIIEGVLVEPNNWIFIIGQHSVLLNGWKPVESCPLPMVEHPVVVIPFFLS